MKKTKKIGYFQIIASAFPSTYFIEDLYTMAPKCEICGVIESNVELRKCDRKLCDNCHDQEEKQVVYINPTQTEDSLIEDIPETQFNPEAEPFQLRHDS